MRKKWILALALLIALGATACGAEKETDGMDDIAGADWRTTGIVQDSGTITRDGEDTDVLVCVHAEDCTFYLDTEEQTLYGYVDYPVALSADPWKAFQSIDFADRNGDDNSDVALMLQIADETALMVWYWDADTEAFAYQPDESFLPSSMEEGRGDVIDAE